MQPADPTLFKPGGCDQCRTRATRAGAGIYELLLIDDAVRPADPEGRGLADHQRAAVAEGMDTLRDDGARKVLRGLTTVEEVLAATQEEIVTDGPFAYTGVDARGKTVRGTVDADDVKGVRQGCVARAIVLDEATPLAQDRNARRAPQARVQGRLRAHRDVHARARPPRRRDGGYTRLFVGWRPRPGPTVAMLTRQLATLVNAGIPLVESLDALIEQIENEELKRALTEVRDQVNEGTRFAKALGGAPAVLPGALHQHGAPRARPRARSRPVLQRLADFIEIAEQAQEQGRRRAGLPGVHGPHRHRDRQRHDGRRRAQGDRHLRRLRQALPWYTSRAHRRSRPSSELLVAHDLRWRPCAVYLFSRWRRTPEGAYKWDSFRLRVPIFGELGG